MGDAGAPQLGAIEHYVGRGAQRRTESHLLFTRLSSSIVPGPLPNRSFPRCKAWAWSPDRGPMDNPSVVPPVDDAAVVAVDAAFAAASAAAAADVAAVAVMGPTRTGSDIQTARIA